MPPRARGGEGRFQLDVFSYIGRLSDRGEGRETLQLQTQHTAHDLPRAGWHTSAVAVECTLKHTSVESQAADGDSILRRRQGPCRFRRFCAAQAFLALLRLRTDGHLLLQTQCSNSRKCPHILHTNLALAPLAAHAMRVLVCAPPHHMTTTFRQVCVCRRHSWVLCFKRNCFVLAVMLCAKQKQLQGASPLQTCRGSVPHGASLLTFSRSHKQSAACSGACASRQGLTSSLMALSQPWFSCKCSRKMLMSGTFRR